MRSVSVLFVFLVRVSRNAVTILCTQMVKYSTVDKRCPSILTLCDLVCFFPFYRDSLQNNFTLWDVQISDGSVNFRWNRFLKDLQKYDRYAHICKELKWTNFCLTGKKYKISIDYCDGMYDRDIHTLFCFFISSCIR